MSRRNPYEFEGPAPDQPVWWTSLDDYAQQSAAPEVRAQETAAEMPEGAWERRVAMPLQPCVSASR